MEIERLKRGEHAIGASRWMAWAPDMREPERYSAGHCTPSLEQMAFAIELGRTLNKHAPEGGTWLVAWTDPHLDGTPTRLAMAWVDKDGDIPFTVDSEDSILTLQKAGVDHFALQAFQAHCEYREQIKATEITPSQMIKARQGQQPRDSRILVPADFG